MAEGVRRCILGRAKRKEVDIKATANAEHQVLSTYDICVLRLLLYLRVERGISYIQTQ